MAQFDDDVGDVKAKLQSPRNAVKDEDIARAPLGSRIAARFAGLGLTQEIPELRGEPARPADLPHR